MRVRRKSVAIVVTGVVMAALAILPASAQTTGALGVAWIDPLPGTNITTYQPVTHASGAVSLLYADPATNAPTIKTVGAGREQLSTVRPSGESFTAVGRNGDAYFTATSKLTARASDGATRWTATLPDACGSPTYPLNVTVGADGDVYALLTPPTVNKCAGSFQLVKYNALTGAAVFTKVLGDWPTTYNVAAYKNGVAVQQDRTVRYFDTSGVETGNFAGPSENVQVNADGTALFALSHPAIASDGCASIAPVVDGILFRTIAGTQVQANMHDCVEAFWVQPLSNGGALVNELGGGAGTLVGVGANGAVNWRKAYPNAVGETSRIAYLTAKSDGNGNIAVVQQTLTGDRYAVDVQVLNAATGVVQASVNTSSFDATASFLWMSASGVPDSIGVTPNRLYLTLAKCVASTGCDAGLYAFDLNGLSLDYPRAAVWGVGGQGTEPTATPTPTVTQKPKLNYVALGDSFSSGEGAGDYYPGTDIPARKSNHNMCHRSKNAYSQLLAADSSLGLKSVGFFACSGAVTPDLFNTYQYETQPPQNLLLSKKDDLVTLTIGGNDIGFGDFTTACASPFTTCVGDPYKKIVKKIDDALPIKLAKAFDAVGRSVNKTGRVIVVGYPMMVQLPSSPLQECGVLNAPEMLLARDVITRLNTAEIQAVVAANIRSQGNGPKFVFLDVNAGDSVFKGRELCTSHSAFNQIRFNGKVDSIFVESLHPNAEGQALYAQAIKRYLIQK